jgi:hypothetical protein
MTLMITIEMAASGVGKFAPYNLLQLLPASRASPQATLPLGTEPHAKRKPGP